VSKPKSVYLAGPEVFLPDGFALIKQKAVLCARYGFVANIPSDTGFHAHKTTAPTQVSREIYRANVATMKSSDFGIFDLTPFRGPSADAGTVFELGLMTGLGKSVFGYTNVPGDYIERIGLKQQAPDPTSPAPATMLWRDENGWHIENFGNADNLMIDSAIAIGGAEMVRSHADFPARFDDLSGFELCLKQAQAFYAKPPTPPRRAAERQR
jgi:nucleoside 2-deoxyribosyltransferase